ncbi:hypothetical protein [Azohydromonas australica]|uniref:hypothetical protein n=1 Tax=Azohydromonas australica TaxID=364039 RepID=UPI0007E8B8A8|nr:hypothetical protein [Azohydromonas australica]
MNLRTTCRAAVTTVLLAAAAAANSAEWSDTFIGYSRGSGFRDPGVDTKVRKDIVNLTHVSGYSLGTNFFNVDMLRSDDHQKAHDSARNAQEVYVVYNTTLSFGKLRKSPVAFGPVRDVGWDAGFDFSSKNDAFGGAVLKLLTGPRFDFNVPGLFAVSALAMQSWGNNSISGADIKYDLAWRLATVWRFDVPLGLPAVFKGWATYTGPTGRDGFGNDTHPETWIETSLLWDLGSLAGKDKVLYGGVGYQYIRNKFSNAKTIPGTKTSTPMLKLEVHF